jgi:uncharacterized protein (TIGR02246 family)
MKLLAFLFAAASLFAQSANDTAVRQLVQKYMDARDQNDARAIAAIFTADADQLVSSGEWRKGREALVKGTMASSQSSGGRRTITVTSVRFLAPAVAIADGHYDLTGLAGGTTRNMWTSIVCTKTADGWRIAAIRNMLPAAPAPVK